MGKTNTSSFLLGAVLGTAVAFGAFSLLHGWWTKGAADVPASGGGDARRSLAPVQVSAVERSASARTSTPGYERLPVDVESRARPGEEQSADDLRLLLSSSDRLDQIRAIRALGEQGTQEANELLLEEFLNATDPILLALLEEELLASELEIAPAVMDAFSASSDPQQLGRLAGMLTKLVQQSPALEQEVVGLFVGALQDPGPNAERLQAVAGALDSIGIGVLEPLAGFLADPLSNPEGAQTAAWVLSHLGAEHGDAVRDRIQLSVANLTEALGDSGLTEAERDAVLRKTQSLTWLAANRPEAEHDRLGIVMLKGLSKAGDRYQAQNLAWGLANLKGMSDAVRQDTARSILESLTDQPDQNLRQSQVWAVSHLAIFYDSRPLDTNFYEILRLAESSEGLHENSQVSVQIQWLLEELRRYETKKRGG